MKLRSLECAVISPLNDLYSLSQSPDVRAASLKILLHVLEVIINHSLNTAFPLSLMVHCAFSGLIDL